MMQERVALDQITKIVSELAPPLPLAGEVGERVSPRWDSPLEEKALTRVASLRGSMIPNQ
ncbi:hypothetical protein AOQ71_24985 [Bradyrhizobium manausense]|uniref:Uncharacterized protein n=1 Tax=Bradyrhizobium manausense TaxID=989370 RepID=A0A0R3DAU8_9BRAD|nr:hypothetical protein AOQ71_24985 [Bradyrhizobium manausense]